MSAVGGSVALVCQYLARCQNGHGMEGIAYRAKAAKVSMIRFSHSSCTARNTLSFRLLYMAVTTVRRTAVILTVIWNCQVSVWAN
jgi:hypothetical protein